MLSINYIGKRAVALLTVACILLPATLQARNWYVKSGAGNYSATLDGTTWDKAFGNLLYATNNAVSGDVIYVGAGTYTTPGIQWTTPTRWASFYVKAGVNIVGGYNGGETTLLGGSGTVSILILEEGSDTTRVSNINFSLQTAGTNGDKNGGAVNAVGNVKAVLTQCNFTTRVGGSGGALYVGKGAYVRVVDSNFAGSVANPSGGAIAVDSATLVVKNCQLHDCSARKGGALYGNAANILVEDSRFYDNFTTGEAQGGAIYIVGGTELVMRKTSAVRHEAGNGGGGLFIDGANNTVLLDYCTVALNDSKQWAPAGGIGGSTGANVTITNSIISGNTGGGGSSVNLDLNTAGVNISNSLIENKVYDEGGAVSGTIPKEDIDIVVDDEGKVDVTLPTTIDGGSTNPFVGDEGDTNIGAGGGGTQAQPQISITLSVSDSVTCVDEQIVFTVRAVNANGNYRYELYRVQRDGVTERMLLGSVTNNLRVAAFTVDMQVASVDEYQAEVYSGKKEASSGIVRVFITPEIIADEIEHVENVED